MPTVFKLRFPDRDKLEAAAGTIAEGGVTVFPTETVYGIGADARRPDAMMRVREVKGKPRDLPLLLHCADEEQALPWVTGFPSAASSLAGRFWPGPLTIVLAAAGSTPAEVTGSLSTVGIRMVSHPVSAELIRLLGAPIAGTSANLRGEEPTGRYADIDPVLLGGTDIAIDSGKCGEGTPSTVIDLSQEKARVLREGAVSLELLSEVLGYLPESAAG